MIEHISVDDGIAYRCLPGLLLQIYGGHGTAKMAPIMRRMTEDPILGPRRLFLNVISATSARATPDEEYRRTGAELLKRYERETVAVAWVVPTAGFVGATARAVLSGIIALSRATTPQQVFSATPDGIAWLVAQAPDLGHTVASVTQQLQEMERALGR